MGSYSNGMFISTPTWHVCFTLFVDPAIRFVRYLVLPSHDNNTQTSPLNSGPTTHQTPRLIGQDPPASIVSVPHKSKPPRLFPPLLLQTVRTADTTLSADRENGHFPTAKDDEGDPGNRRGRSRNTGRRLGWPHRSCRAPEETESDQSKGSPYVLRLLHLVMRQRLTVA
jgi:hypothetical protein